MPLSDFSLSVVISTATSTRRTHAHYKLSMVKKS